jgi:hypothetical protein
MKLSPEEKAYRQDVYLGLRLAKECLLGGGHVTKDPRCFCCNPQRMGECIVWLSEPHQPQSPFQHQK